MRGEETREQPAAGAGRHLLRSEQSGAVQEGEESGVRRLHPPVTFRQDPQGAAQVVPAYNDMPNAWRSRAASWANSSPKLMEVY